MIVSNTRELDGQEADMTGSDGQVASRITFNAGDHHILRKEEYASTEIVFQVGLFSALVQGSAHCNGIAPGVSMQIESGPPPVPPGELDDWCEAIWDSVAPSLRRWLDLPAAAPAREKPLIIELLPVRIQFVPDDVASLPAGAIQLDAACETFGKAGGSGLLGAINAPPPRQEALLAIKHALECSLRSGNPDLWSLSLVVRSRASGALQAWEDAMHITGESGATLLAKLRDPERNP